MRQVNKVTVVLAHEFIELDGEGSSRQSNSMTFERADHQVIEVSIVDMALRIEVRYGANVKRYFFPMSNVLRWMEE